MNTIKNLIIPTGLLVLSFLISCDKQEMKEPAYIDNEKPGVIENVVLTPIHGGFDITYSLPDDDDLLYVKAVYEDNNGNTSEVKSSIYSPKIQILGFNNIIEKEIKIFAVDRSENMSDPIIVSGQPLEAPINLIEKSLSITAAFGGAKFSWTNKAEAPMFILFLAENEDGEMELQKTLATSLDSSKFTLRGFESEPRKFAAVIRDKWDYFSDTIYPATPDLKLTPYFEERFDFKKFNHMDQFFENDSKWDAWGYSYTYAFDGDEKGKSFCHSYSTMALPHIISIDLGQEVILSRVVLYQRQGSNGKGNFAYGDNNPKDYIFYGKRELNLPEDKSGDLSSWDIIKECESIKPSGLPLWQVSDEDMATHYAGEEQEIEFDKPIRYFRMSTSSNWANNAVVNFSEITFFGKVANEEEEEEIEE